MLCTLLLFCAIQNPDPNPGLVADQQFYAAIHAYEVESRPDEAVDMFQKLLNAEHPAYTETGHAMILIHLARALDAAGRTDEAASTLAAARQLVSTDSARFGAAEALLRQTTLRGPSQEGLDPSLVDLVREALSKDDGSYEALSRYGRRILPYLSSELDRYQGGPTSQDAIRTLTRILSVGIPVGDAAFRAKVQQTLAPYSADMLGAILGYTHPDTFLDDSARDFRDRLLYEGSLEQDPTRARAFATAAAAVLDQHDSQLLRQRLAEILGSADDPLAPFLLDALPWREDTNPFRQSGLPLIAARSPQALVAQESRWRMYTWRWLPEIAELLPGGDTLDQLRFVRLMMRYNGTPSGAPIDVYQRILTALNSGTRGGRSAIFKETADGKPYLPHLRALLQSASPEVRLGAAEGLLEFKDAPGAAAALRSTDPDVVRVALFGLAVWGEFPSELDATVRGYLAQDAFQHEAAQALLRVATRLDVESLARILQLGLVAKPEDLKDLLDRWSKTAEGQAKLHDFVLRPEVAAGFKALAYWYLLATEPSAGDAAFTLFQERGQEPDQGLGWTLAGYWIPYLADGTIRDGRITPAVHEAFVELLPFGVRGGNSNSYLYALTKMLDAHVPEAVALAGDLLEKPAGFFPVFMTSLHDDSASKTWAPTVFASLIQRKIQTDLVWRYAGSFLSGGSYDADAVKVLLQDGRSEFADMALRILRQNPEQVGKHEDDVLRLLRASDSSALAAAALASAGSKYVPNLIAAWQEVEVQDRTNYISALGSTGDERVVPVLMEALGSPREEIRNASAKALDELKTLREQREFWEAWQVTGAGASPVAALIPKLKSENLEVRLAAIESLGTLKAKETLPLLVELLESPEPKVVDAARKALAKINE